MVPAAARAAEGAREAVIGPTTQVEAWIVQRLAAPLLFEGVTTADDRRERVRRVIHHRGLELAIAGRRDGGKCETWQELFERIYGEPLDRNAAAPKQ